MHRIRCKFVCTTLSIYINRRQFNMNFDVGLANFRWSDRCSPWRWQWWATETAQPWNRRKICKAELKPFPLGVNVWLNLIEPSVYQIIFRESIRRRKFNPYFESSAWPNWQHYFARLEESVLSYRDQGAARSGPKRRVPLGNFSLNTSRNNPLKRSSWVLFHSELLPSLGKSLRETCSGESSLDPHNVPWVLLLWPKTVLQY